MKEKVTCIILMERGTGVVWSAGERQLPSIKSSYVMLQQSVSFLNIFILKRCLLLALVSTSP